MFITSNIFSTQSISFSAWLECSIPAWLLSSTGICWGHSWSHDAAEVRGQLFSPGLEKEPSCLVLTSFSCSSCLCPRLYRYSMCITSVFLMRAFSLNSSRIRGMKPGLSCPARRNCLYRARTCFCSLLCRAINLPDQRSFFKNEGKPETQHRTAADNEKTSAENLQLQFLQCPLDAAVTTL